MTKEKLKYEIKSFLKTFFAVLLAEGALNTEVFMGDFSDQAFKALIFAIVRAALKTVIDLTFNQPNAPINESSEANLTPPPNETTK